MSGFYVSFIHNSYMIVRVGFLVAATAAAYAVNQKRAKAASQAKPTENGEESYEKSLIAREDEEHLTFSKANLNEAEVEEEKEEVKQINSIINPRASITSDFADELLPEFESLVSGEIDIPLPTDKYDTSANSMAEKERIYESEMANHASELESLRRLVKELEEREVKLEGELLEYYGLKEQESSIVELQKQLKIKTVEIDMLNVTINILQAERKKLQEEVSQGATARKELEMTKKKLHDLQRQIQLEANQTKAHLLLLKQQVTWLQAKEEETFKKNTDVEKKLKFLKEMEVEIVELKRKNRELQIEKRELTVKLDAAEGRVKTLSSMTESEMVANVREEVNNLRHTMRTFLRAFSFTTSVGNLIWLLTFIIFYLDK